MSDIKQQLYDQRIARAIKAAHEIQDHLFGEENWSKVPFNQRDWAAAFQKRVDAIAAVDFSRPMWKVELRKRLLQLASLAIKADEAVDRMAEIRVKDIPPTVDPLVGFVESTDLKLLREQKLTLIRTATDGPYETVGKAGMSAADGIVHFLDNFQDMLVKSGMKTKAEVFGKLDT